MKQDIMRHCASLAKKQTCRQNLLTGLMLGVFVEYTSNATVVLVVLVIMVSATSFDPAHSFFLSEDTKTTTAIIAAAVTKTNPNKITPILLKSP